MFISQMWEIEVTELAGGQLLLSKLLLSQTSTKTRKVPDKGGRHPTGPPASTKAIDSAARFRPLPDRALELQSTVHFQSLATETKLQLQQLLTFERQGFCITRGLLSQDCMLELQQAVAASLDQKRLAALKQRVRVLCPGVKPSSIKNEAQAMAALARHGTDEVGFLQFFHLHRSSPVVDAVVRSKRLAGVAAQLLGVNRVRLYQDCVFQKQPGFADTNWHSDLRMAPFDTNSFITAWLPLRPIAAGSKDSGLRFAAGSHRDFALPFWHNLQGRDLGDRGYKVMDTGPMQLGDVSWHHGWTLHSAGSQPPGTPPRAALAVSYFADGAKLLARKTDPSILKILLHDEDAESYMDWVKDVADGAVVSHDATPLVYP
eukprot:jgi/Chrzof1/697/Cz01g25070.t1